MNTMTRGELAKECGVNIEALRYYETMFSGKTGAVDCAHGNCGMGSIFLPMSLLPGRVLKGPRSLRQTFTR